MDRIWQWAWDRYPARYSWALFSIGFALSLPIFLLVSLQIVGFEKSSRYVEATAVTAVAVFALVVLIQLPCRASIRSVERWAAGEDIDRATALTATYVYTRRGASLSVWTTAVWTAGLSVVIGMMVGATSSRLLQYALLGVVFGAGSQLIAIHNIFESAMRPARVSLAGGTGLGDSLPRSSPTFASRSKVAMVAVALVFATVGALLAAILDWTSDIPVLAVVIGCALALVYAVPISVSLGFSPSLQPIRDLADGAERVAAGDYSQRLPVVQDDDLGALVASFNRMQAGLAERQRLQAAFGTYVDPALATRLLQQGDDIFTGERREVSVMFVDIRDFTPFAEANTAEDTVARLNALFDIVVPAVVDAGGHVNKFLGDGALAVFGAPNDLADHADAALNAAVLIHHRVKQRFGDALQIGIGINTGTVIAGTIGGGGKLEFTLIGDTVNVAARVEQLTKTTGDTILLTRQCVNALNSRPAQLTDRGYHGLKGKTAAVQVYGLGPVA